MPTVMLLNLQLAESNEQLRDRMRAAKDAREAGTFSNVVCTIDGFGKDHRELEQIPEVRAFTRRLVALGFPAYLDVCPSADPQLNGSLGAAELIVMAEGRRLPEGPVAPELAAEVNAGIVNARRIAAATLGPLVPRRGQADGGGQSPRSH